MYKKFIILVLNTLILINSSSTFAKYVFKTTLDVATLNTGGNYYLITYTERNDTIEKVEKLDKGENHDSDGQILRIWIMNKRKTLETIKIEDDSGDIKDCSYLFGGISEVAVCLYITKIDLSGFNMENVTNMTFMFYDCIRLTELNISNFNTSKVTDMSYMFFYCQSLKTLDLRSFNTYNVKNMDTMFCMCQSMQEILVSSNWTTENANTKDMFLDCGVSTVTLYN